MRLYEFDQPRAAGCVLYAEDTGRWGFQQRSDSVTDPGVWSTWGGGREPGETLEQCVRRELAEEGGYRGPIRLEPLNSNSAYVTFVGYVPHEFEPTINSEVKDWCWVEADQLPEPMHPELMQVLSEESELDKATMKKHTILQQLQQMPLTIFGSVATKGLDQANDFDVFLDLDANPDHKKYIKSTLSLSRQYYGWIDPFVLKDKVLYVRNDTATGWQRARNSVGILKNIKLQGRPISDININENFADGKKPGRKGLAKRMGVPTRASVTRLRQIAKSSTGEKARMAHWLANMKSGRKK